mmetsp:Transcript_136409/g.423846  ORF Transcript_136409/g.423846 Transcript_136409/m.423846 type:complete len:535 (-) Transcript_136409:415-2019(-)
MVAGHQHVHVCDRLREAENAGDGPWLCAPQERAAAEEGEHHDIARVVRERGGLCRDLGAFSLPHRRALHLLPRAVPVRGRRGPQHRGAGGQQSQREPVQTRVGGHQQGRAPEYGLVMWAGPGAPALRALHRISHPLYLPDWRAELHPNAGREVRVRDRGVAPRELPDRNLLHAPKVEVSHRAHPGLVPLDAPRGPGAPGALPAREACAALLPALRGPHGGRAQPRDGPVLSPVVHVRDVRGPEHGGASEARQHPGQGRRVQVPHGRLLEPGGQGPHPGGHRRRAAAPGGVRGEPHHQQGRLPAPGLRHLAHHEEGPVDRVAPGLPVDRPLSRRPRRYDGGRGRGAREGADPALEHLRGHLRNVLRGPCRLRGRLRSRRAQQGQTALLSPLPVVGLPDRLRYGDAGAGAVPEASAGDEDMAYRAWAPAAPLLHLRHPLRGCQRACPHRPRSRCAPEVPALAGLSETHHRLGHPARAGWLDHARSLLADDRPVLPHGRVVLALPPGASRGLPLLHVGDGCEVGGGAGRHGGAEARG